MFSIDLCAFEAGNDSVIVFVHSPFLYGKLESRFNLSLRRVHISLLFNTTINFSKTNMMPEEIVSYGMPPRSPDVA